MPAPTSPGDVKQPFAEQIAAIRKRTENLIPTARWTDLMRNGHDRGFAVAGAMKMDLLADFAGAIDKVVAEGKSIQWFRENFDQIVARHGWDYVGERNWRTRTIYTTNMRTSYAAGRLAQLRDPDLRKAAPYWMYRHGGSQDPRPQHLAWDKLTLPADDPWFKVHYPPNGWGCSCYVVAVSEAQAHRQGGRLEQPPETDPKGAIDKGWDYMPGDSVADELRQFVEGKLTQAPALPGSEMWASLPTAIMQRQTAAFAALADRVATDKKARGEHMMVGAIEPVVVRALAERKIEPQTAAMAARDSDVLHTHRDAKTHKLPWDWYRELPRHLPERKAVLLDRSGDHPTLLYVFDDPADPQGIYKLVVPLDYRIKVRDETGKHVHERVNLVRSGRRLPLVDLRAGQYEVLDGKL